MNLTNLKAWIWALVLLGGFVNATNLAESTEDSSANPSDSIPTPSLRGDSIPTPSLRGSEADEATQTNSCIDCHDSTQSVESRNDESNSQDSRSIFSTAPINGDTFGAFAVGYQMLSKRHSLIVANLNHSAFFALDRGWIFVDNALLFALSLDGSAGEFYSINIGAKLGYRALSGRIIPNIAVSYGLFNHKINDAQHNFHGATATLSLFVDIAQGFGVEVAYRVGLHPFPTLKKTSEKANVHSFMVNLRFMDFGI